MKKFLCLFILGILSLAAYSQDLIVKKDGSVIQAKVAEIGTSEVKYKKWTNQEGPTYSIAIADILAINYPDGSKEEFANTSATSQEVTPHEAGVPQLVAVPVADNNAALIAQCNQTYSFGKTFKRQGKVAKEGVAQFWFDESSVISNNELEMSFVHSDAMQPSGFPVTLDCYCIVLKNKTDALIYVDLANCFRVNESANDAYCYYKSELTNVTTSGSTGASFNLGGVTSALGVGGVVGALAGATTVGGSKGTSVQKVYSQQQIISVPPHGSRKLSDFKYIKKEIIEEGEWFRVSVPKGTVAQGEVKHYTFENSPLVYDYTITYSTKSDFSQYSQLRYSMYLANLYGLDGSYYWWGWEKTKEEDKPTSVFKENTKQMIFGHMFTHN